MLQAVETQLRGIREQGRLPRGPQGLGHRETVLEAREELQETNLLSRTQARLLSANNRGHEGPSPC